MKYNKDFILFTLSIKPKDNKERKLVFCIKHLYLAIHILLAIISSLVMIKIQWGYSDFIWFLKQIRMDIVADALINFGVKPGNPVFNHSINSFIMVPMIVIINISSYVIATTLFGFIRKIHFPYFSLIVCLLILCLTVRAFLFSFGGEIETFWKTAFIYAGIVLTRIVVAWILANLIIKKYTVESLYMSK